MLKELIELLEKEDPELVVPHGFGYPYSYRGYYGRLAVAPMRDQRVGDMLAALKGAIGKTYMRCKGWEYVMREDSEVHLAERGSCGPELTADLLQYFVDEGKKAAEAKKIEGAGQQTAADSGWRCWVAFYSDLSRVVVFKEEIAALRYAVENGMHVRKLRNGEVVKLVAAKGESDAGL